MMKTDELLELYKSLSDTWRFEVNSHWQRSSYFAAFETVAIAAYWKLLTGPYDSRWAVLLSVLGVLLTAVWFLNNQKTRAYCRHWLRSLISIETKLIERCGEADIDFARQILFRHRTDIVKHPYLVQAVPTLFYLAWIMPLLFGISPPVVEFRAVHHLLTFDSASLAVGIVSFFVSVAATLIARSSLSQAKQVAEREQRDWKQRKWADMYLKADEVYDALDRFRVLYSSWDKQELQREWSDLMRLIRGAHAMAVVFPQNAAVGALLSSTAVFKEVRALSDVELAKVFDAVELIRERALLPSTILE